MLLDVNDNAPQFNRLFYSKSVPENAEIGSIIVTVTATDKDKNRSIHYSIEDYDNTTLLIDVGTASGKFLY